LTKTYATDAPTLMHGEEEATSFLMESGISFFLMNWLLIPAPD